MTPLLYFCVISGTKHHVIFHAFVEIETFRPLSAMMQYFLVQTSRNISTRSTDLQINKLPVAAQTAANIRLHRFTSMELL